MEYETEIAAQARVLVARRSNDGAGRCGCPLHIANREDRDGDAARRQSRAGDTARYQRDGRFEKRRATGATKPIRPRPVSSASEEGIGCSNRRFHRAATTDGF